MNLRRIVALGAASAAVATLAMLGAACGNSAAHHTTTSITPDTSATQVAVQLSNWAIKASPDRVPAGIIQFVATHQMDHSMMDGSQGGETHDLDVARKSADGSYKMMGSVKDISMGESKSLYLTLEPGEYELQCNVVEQVDGNAISHYAKGMHETFTVS
ncbi:hypothetical protein J0H33_06055 [bacterium]|nr:hypothetical protein [bacterium]